MKNIPMEELRKLYSAQGPGALAGALAGMVVEQAAEGEASAEALAQAATALALLNLANAAVATSPKARPIAVPANFDPRGGMRQ